MTYAAYPILFALAGISPLASHDHPASVLNGDDPCPLSATPISDATPCYEPPAHPHIRHHHVHKDSHDRAGQHGSPDLTDHQSA